MAAADPLHWPRYLDAALLVYRISYHRVSGLSPFKALYGRDPVIPSSVLPLVNSLGPGSAEADMRLIANELFRLQALAASSLTTTTSRESERRNVDQPELPSFALDDMVLFSHHRPGGRSHKLATTWSRPYRVVHRLYNEYSIAAVNTGVVVNRVHSQFLRAFLPPVKRFKGALSSTLR